LLRLRVAVSACIDDALWHRLLRPPCQGTPPPSTAAGTLRLSSLTAKPLHL